MSLFWRQLLQGKASQIDKEGANLLFLKNTPVARDAITVAGALKITKAGVAQLVELQPSKLNVASSSLVSRSK